MTALVYLQIQKKTTHVALNSHVLDLSHLHVYVIHRSFELQYS